MIFFKVKKPYKISQIPLLSCLKPSRGFLLARRQPVSRGRLGLGLSGSNPLLSRGTSPVSPSLAPICSASQALEPVSCDSPRASVPLCLWVFASMSPPQRGPPQAPNSSRVPPFHPLYLLPSLHLPTCRWLAVSRVCLLHCTPVP